jgi:lysozyme family protein
METACRWVAGVQPCRPTYSTPMTIDDVIDGILDREKEGDASKGYLDPNDQGGRTTWGISERSHPDAWKDGPPSREQAREIYRSIYVTPFLWVNYQPLRVQLIDIAVHSGVTRAVRLLQIALGITVDGRIGEQTQYYTQKGKERDWRILNNALVAHRLHFVDTITDNTASQKRFEEGWESRSLVFVV